MCGIAGFVSSNFNYDNLVEMTNSLYHRGPDSNGYYFNKEKNIGLGHRRLSIIDLSDNANQPMTSHCGNYKMVYNGEVYNYKSIAKELNIKLRSQSDSEVILEAFVKWGKNFVNKLNGMFAIAIYDISNNQLHLFRDRLGIKPLYYYQFENEFLFSSEIKAFKKLNINLEINTKAIFGYLHYGYIPKENSIYKYIHKLPAGSAATYNNQQLTTNSYWKIENKIAKNTLKNFSNAKTQLKSVLYDSVEKRLISDVPIGTFLSGGTDSSLVTSIASKVSNNPVNTFSIGYKEAKFNESDKAKLIAKHLKTNHHDFIVSENDVLAELDQVLDNFDEPFADSSCFPTYLVSKLAKKHVSVCLSGDGGDELFMGYGAYNWAKRLSNPFLWNFRKTIALGLKYSGKERNKRASLVFNSPNEGKMSHIFSQEQYLFSKKELEKLLIKPNKDLIEEKINSERQLTNKETQSFFDIKNYLKDDLLVKVDRSSMLSSLEVRVPLLDHRIVELALNINEPLKTSNGVSKYLLKELLYEHVPKELLDHPKWGFSIPLAKWLKKELKYLIDDYLNDDIINQYKLFNLKEIQQLKHRFFSGEEYLYNRVWQLIVINRFLKKNI